jgi:hypothetical protein
MMLNKYMLIIEYIFIINLISDINIYIFHINMIKMKKVWIVQILELHSFWMQGVYHYLLTGHQQQHHLQHKMLFQNPENMWYLDENTSDTSIQWQT